MTWPADPTPPSPTTCAIDYVTGNAVSLIFSHSHQLAPAYERLAALFEQHGDTGTAIYYYRKLVALWESADPELRPRIAAARRAIEAFSTDR